MKSMIHKIKQSAFWATYGLILVISGVFSAPAYFLGNELLFLAALVCSTLIIIGYSFYRAPLFTINSKESRYKSLRELGISREAFQWMCTFCAYLFHPILFTFGFWMLSSIMISNIAVIDIPFFGYFSIAISSLLYLIFFKRYIEAAGRPVGIDTDDVHLTIPCEIEV